MAAAMDALSAALAMTKSPHIIKVAQTAPLPKGMTFLLEIAALEGQALDRGSAATGLAQMDLEKAASFFIEQVLFFRQADSYRVLGADAAASDAELRRHMALIMKWLHPDKAASGPYDFAFDKTVYASRVTTAWENLKTAERRAAYDAQPKQRQTRGGLRQHSSQRNGHAAPQSVAKRSSRKPLRSGGSQHELTGFWTRLRHRLKGRST